MDIASIPILCTGTGLFTRLQTSSRQLEVGSGRTGGQSQFHYTLYKSLDTYTFPYTYSYHLIPKLSKLVGYRPKQKKCTTLCVLHFLLHFLADLYSDLYVSSLMGIRALYTVHSTGYSTVQNFCTITIGIENVQCTCKCTVPFVQCTCTMYSGIGIGIGLRAHNLEPSRKDWL